MPVQENGENWNEPGNGEGKCLFLKYLSKNKIETFLCLVRSNKWSNGVIKHKTLAGSSV